MRYLSIMLMVLSSFAFSEEYSEKFYPAIQTHLGALSIVDRRDSDGVRHRQLISLNGNKIYEARLHYIRYVDSFNFQGGDYLVIGENSGGTGNRYDELTILKIEGNAVIQSFFSNDFYSVKDQYSKEILDANVVIDLGLEKQKNKKAKFEGNNLSIVLEDAKYIPLSLQDCRDLYEIAIQCEQYNSYSKVNCEHEASYFLPASNSGMWTFRYIAEQTGFNQNNFKSLCLSACQTGKLDQYEQFSKKVCETP